MRDEKTAIEQGDAALLRELLAEDPARANAAVQWGKNGCILTAPLHYVSDMLFDGTLQRGKELALVDALIDAGAAVDFHSPGRSETALILCELSVRSG
jgi:hypothetical protein